MKNIVPLLACLLSISAIAQKSEITEFNSSDGTISWTNPNTNQYYGIEYTNDLIKNRWEHPTESMWWNIQSTNSEISVQMPMAMLLSWHTQLYFRVVSSVTPLPLGGIDLEIGYWPSSTDKWWLIGRVTTEEASRVFITGDYITGEFDLAFYEMTEDGLEKWTSYNTGNHNLGEEPVFPVNFQVHIVTVTGTNTYSETVNNYVTY